MEMLTTLSCALLALSLTSATQQTQTGQTQTGQTQSQTQTQTSMPKQGEKMTMPSQGALSDADFMKQATLGGKLEVDLAQMAKTKSDNDKLKKAAEAIEKDHTDANAELRMIADRADVALPGLTDEQKATKDRFQTLSGAEFDRAWIDQMIKDHEAAIDLFTKGTKATDVTVRTFAESKLPALKNHLQMVKDLQAGK
jgi:putative membrane protein